MIFSDLHLPVPEGPNLKRLRSAQGYVYLRYVPAYSVVKQHHNKSYSLGRIRQDERTGQEYLCPSQNYFLKFLQQPLPEGHRKTIRWNRSAGGGDRHEPFREGERSSAFMLACRKTMQKLCLESVLQDCFGRLSPRLITAAVFFAAGAPGGLSSVDHFAWKHGCPAAAGMQPDELSCLCEELPSYLMQDFWHSWIKRHASRKQVCNLISLTEWEPDSLEDITAPLRNIWLTHHAAVFCDAVSGTPLYLYTYTESDDMFDEAESFISIAEAAAEKGLAEHGLLLISTSVPAVKAQQQIQQAGFMLPADLNLTAEAVRRLSRNRADIELTFAPVYLGSFDYKPDTKLFLSILGLILRQALLHELQDLRLSLNLTADDAMTLLCHLSCTFHKGHWFAERGIETLQHQLADKLQLPLCYLEKPVARR